MARGRNQPKALAMETSRDLTRANQEHEEAWWDLTKGIEHNAHDTRGEEGSLTTLVNHTQSTSF